MLFAAAIATASAFTAAETAALKRMKETKITVKEFDRRFEAGEDISEFVNWKASRRPGREIQRVNVDFPVWMVTAMDEEASRIGVSRQALIKFIICKNLDLI